MKKVSGILLPALLLAVLVSSITAVSLHAKYLTVSDVKYFNLKVTADYFMHFDANGGTLTSPTEDDDTWSGVSETTATKVVEVGQPCGELPAAERTGYTFAGWGPDSRLPDGFQEVEFLESSGNEYIDTEYKPYQSTFGFDIDLIFYNDLSGIRTVMSVYDTWDSSSACFGLGGNYQAYCSQCIGWTGAASQIGTCLTPGERGRITTVNNGDYDGATGKSTYTVTSPLITKTYQATGNKTVKNPLPVFSGRSGSGIAEKSHTRIYSLKLLECNTPVRDFVPAVWQGGETTYSKGSATTTGPLAANTAGFFDLVGKVFYVNSGTGEFKVGDPVGGVGAVISETTVADTPDDRTLVAHWTPNTYTLTLDYNDGATPDGSLTVTYDDTYAALPTPKRAGHTFDGWFDGDTEFKKTDTVLITEDTELTAHWTAHGYTVTFDPGKGGTVSPASKQVTFGQPYGELPTPEREGYAFTGWVSGRLPVGYQEVEYLESTGKTGQQYIDTGYLPKQQSFGYVADLIYYDDWTYPGYIATVMCVYDSWNSSGACFSIGGNYKNVICGHNVGWIAGEGASSVSCAKPGERGTISIVNNNDFDGARSTVTVKSPLLNTTEYVTGTKELSGSNLTLSVFCAHYGGSFREHSHARIYSLKLLEYDEPVRDFVPAVWQGGETTYSKNGVTVTGTLAEDTPGLYDLVGKVFYVNSGSVDDFKFGDPVSNGAVVDGDTPVAIPGNHTLYAAWEEAALTMLMVPGEEIPEEEAAEETPAEEQPAPEEEAKEEPPEETPEEELPAEETSGEEIPAEEGEEAIAEEPEEKTPEEPAEAIPEERSDEPEAPPEKTEVPESASPVSEAEETSAE